MDINLCDRSLCRAKGVIAIGNVATGLIAIGGFSAGLLTLGGFSAGLLALGGLAAGGISLGGLSVGLLAALGGAAFSLGIAFGFGAVSGYAALGGAAVGQYAAGGTAFGSTLAIGRDAYSSAAGLALTLEQLHGYSPEVLFQMIHAQDGNRRTYLHADFSLMEITGFWFFFLIVIVFPTVFEFVIGVIQIEPGGVETETDQTGYRFFMKIKSPALSYDVTAQLGKNHHPQRIH